MALLDILAFDLELAFLPTPSDPDELIANIGMAGTSGGKLYTCSDEQKPWVPTLQPEAVQAAIDHLWKIYTLPNGIVVGWNSSAFDFRVLHDNCGDRHYQTMCRMMALETYDLMLNLWWLCGWPVRLQDAVVGTLGKSKLMDGAQAVVDWRIPAHRKNVDEYVVADAQLTLELAQHIISKKYLAWMTKSGSFTGRLFPGLFKTKALFNREPFIAKGLDEEIAPNLRGLEWAGGI